MIARALRERPARPYVFTKCSRIWTSTGNKFQEPQLSRNLAVVERVREIGAARHGRSPGEVAVAWTLGHPAVTGAIVGFRRPEQVDDLTGAADFRLTADERAEVDSL